MNKFQSTVLIELVDSATGQVVDSRTETNILTSESLSKTTSFASTTITGQPRIWISERRLPKIPTTGGAAGISTSNGSVIVASQTPTVFAATIPKTAGTPYVAEYRCQFDPASSNRTIWTLGLCASSSTITPISIVLLTTPCVQQGTVPGPGQILVVTYRIQMLEFVDVGTTIPGASQLDRYLVELFTDEDYVADGNVSVRNRFGVPYIVPYWNNIIPSNLGLFVSPSRGAYASTNSASAGSSINGYVPSTYKTTNAARGYYQYGCNQLTTPYTSTDEIGAIIGNFTIGPANNTGLGGIGGGIWQQGCAVTLYAVPAVNSQWQPAQTIFSHSAGGTEPFQQVSALATGTGVVNISATNWTYPSWPEYYRTSVVASGNVGVARYTFSKAFITGFTTNSAGTGSSWTTSPMSTMLLPAKGYSDTGTIRGTGGISVPSQHNIVVHPSNDNDLYGTIQSMYPIKHSMYAWDATGVTTYNVKTEQYASWDAASSPALPVTAVRQCAVDPTGIIWVACANTGLWRVDPVAETVVNITTFATITTTAAYAVAVGHGNTILAVVDGGVVTSTDSGTTWQQRSFTYAGISDGNWSQVRWICIQQHSPSLRCGLGVTSDADGTGATSGGSIVWWSTSTSPVAGPTMTSSHFQASTSSGRCVFSYPRTMTASRSGNMWVMGTIQGTFFALWGSTTMRSVGNASTAAVRTRNAADCVYDYYGSPHTGVVARTVGASSGYVDLTNQGMSIGQWNVSASSTLAVAPFLELGDKVTLARGRGETDRLVLWTPCPNFYGIITTLNSRVSRNLEHTAYEELMWDNYQWNGSSWVANYHAPAVDTAGFGGGPYNGTRHRFDVESHTFTGRSTITVPTAALTANASTALTISARITPQTNLSGQLPIQQLASYANMTTGDTIKFMSNDGAGSISLIAKTSTQKFLTGSSSSVSLATGSRTFTVEAGLSYTVGMRVRIAPVISTPVSPASTYMEGAVTSYAGTSLVVSVDYVSGATATYTSWIADFIGYRFGTAPAYASTSSIAFVINGATATCFVNGVQSGGSITLPFTPNFSASSGILTIGGNPTNFVDGAGFENSVEFFRGTVQHLVIDSLAWSSVNAAAYHSTPATYATGSTFIRYDLTQSLAGLESKATHSGPEVIQPNITIQFTNGTGTSFVSGEYYTNGVVKGLLKDNATSFTHKFEAYYLPVTHNFSDVTPTTIPGTGATVTEPVYFRYAALTSPNYATLPGLQPVSTAAAFSFQSSADDISATCTVGADRASTDTTNTYTEFGLNDSNVTFPSGSMKWLVRIRYGDTRLVDVSYNGTAVASGITTWVYGDVFSVSRVAGVITFSKNGTPFWSSSGGQNSTSRLWVGTRNQAGDIIVGLTNITVTYPKPPYVVCIGSEGGLTGKYAPNYHSTSGTRASNYVVNIAGYATPATVTLASNATTSIEMLAAPGANTVVIAPEPGYMVFHPSDVGKGVTLSCSVVYTPQ